MSSLPYDLLGALERWPVLMATLSVAVCVALQWTKRREELGARVSQLGRRSLELVQWALACPLALRIVAVVRYQVQHPPEWDFLGFWLHGRSAVSGLDFYEPQSTRRMLGELVVSDEFRREIIDVGFWYPPPSMFWFTPLGWFERGVALPYWYALQALAAVSSIGLLWLSFRRGGRSLELSTCVLLTLSCQATLSTFVFAQTTFLALAFYAAFSLVPERSWGGAWLALAALVKPPLALVALCSLPARRWRVGSVLLLTLGGLSLAAAGCWGVGTFLHYLRPTTVKPDWIFVEPTNQSLLGVVLRASSSSAPVSGPVAVYALLGLIVLAVTARRLLELVSEGEGYGPLAFGLTLS
ncbi:MAG TPA: glycosyltransferase family 87 protein, partial [Polyangiaceae bacterium]|nr:glycosyltransferase family 87 protein [Polyangiaceae bacterium]